MYFNRNTENQKLLPTMCSYYLSISCLHSRTFFYYSLIVDLPDNDKVDLSKQLIAQLTCKICISSAVGIIFLPCAHLGMYDQFYCLKMFCDFPELTKLRDRSIQSSVNVVGGGGYCLPVWHLFGTHHRII